MSFDAKKFEKELMKKVEQGVQKAIEKKVKRTVSGSTGSIKTKVDLKKNVVKVEGLSDQQAEQVKKGLK